MSQKNGELFTLGHSNRSREDFLSLLSHYSVDRIVDVRSYPNSRRFPQFCEGNLEDDLVDAGIGYEHWPELGGYRDSVPDSPNTALGQGFQAVADHLNSEDGQQALNRFQEAIQESGTNTVAIMCAEKNYRECHRKLIADHLVVRGYTVKHLVDDSKVDEHELHQHAREEDGVVTYPGLV